MFYRTKSEPKFKVTNKIVKGSTMKDKIISIDEVRVQFSNGFFKKTKLK